MVEYKLKLTGNITQGGYTEHFTEKDVVHIDIQKGDKKLFYESNDEFRRLRELEQRLKKRIEGLENQKPIQEPNFSFHHIALYELQNILEGEK